MLSKREFIGLYDEAVLNIRQIKNSNDKINKSIRIASESDLYREAENDKHVIEGLFSKASQLIEKMERNYLDPDTARKIGVVKQQFKIQKERRAQLNESVKQITKEFQHKRFTPKDEHFPTPKQKQSETPKHSEYDKKSMITDIDNSTSQTDNQQHRYQMQDYDYEIEKRLIHDRAQQLNHANERIINIKNIVNETSELAYQHGEKLDIITDDLFMTFKSITIGNHELDEANKNQRKSNKKYMILSLFLIVCAGICFLDACLMSATMMFPTFFKQIIIIFNKFKWTAEESQPKLNKHYKEIPN